MRHVMLTLALCSACGMPEGEVVSQARQDELIRRSDDDGIIIMNGLSPAQLGENLLLNDAVTRAKLINSPLTTLSFSSGALALAVREDARAREVLKYVVRCALGPTASITAGGRTYFGDADLCPSWATVGIDSNPTCQREVTACLLGVSNVLGAHVPVSMRGVARPAAASMHPRSFLSSGATVNSLKPCETTAFGMDSDCGWDPVDDAAADSANAEMIFACAPGSTVTLGGGSTCSGSMLGTMSPGSDKVLRVCAGLAACDRATAIAANQGDCGSYRPYVEFTCPVGGLYVVMQRDYAVYVPAGPRGAMTVGQVGSLGPVPETTLFPVREAAFYGTLFEGAIGRKVTFNAATGMLETTVATYKAPIFERLYSCLDADWASPEAYRSRRICSLGGQCLSDNLGVCQTGVCGGVVGDSPVGSGAFSSCRGRDGLLYDDALTTFLRARCDLISPNPMDLACKRP